VSWPVAVAFGSAFLNGVIGALAYLRARGAPIYRSLAILSFSFSFWSISYLRNWPDFDDPLWMKILFTPLAWMPAAGLSFILSYTGMPDRDRRQRCWPLYGLAAIALVGLWSGRIWLEAYRVGFVFVAFPVFTTGIVVLYRHILRAEDPDERNRRMYLFAATVIAVFGGLTDFIPKVSSPIPALANPALMAYSLIVLMAIERHHLMDLREAAGQAGVLLGVSLFSAAFLSGLAWLTRKVEGPLFLNFFMLNLGLLLAIPILWERINRSFTRWVFVQQSRRDRALDALDRGLEGAADLGVVAEAAAEMVREAWGTSCELLWVQRALRGLQSRAVLPERVRAALAEAPEPATAAGLRRSFGSADADLLAALRERRCEAVVPVLREGELIGALLIGPPAQGLFDAAALKSLNRLGASLARAVRGAEMTMGLLHADRLAQLGTLSAGIAHEVRNPLSAILGAVELMQMPIKETDRKEYLEILQREVERLNGTLTDLLDYASAKPKEGRCDWLELWGRVEKLMRTDLPDGLVLEASKEPVALAVTGAHLQQILFNLVKNAIRAAVLDGAGSPPTVRVRLEGEDGRAVLCVEDNGPGIPEEMMARLFAPFATASVGGTGLGLATVRRLAELYGGRAWAENAEVGARFLVELPLAEGDNKGPIVESNGDPS